MLVAVKVPLDEPFLIKYSERRHMTLSADGSAHQDLVINDAGSNHVVVNVLDPNVRIREVGALPRASPLPRTEPSRPDRLLRRTPSTPTKPIETSASRLT